MKTWARIMKSPVEYLINETLYFNEILNEMSQHEVFSDRPFGAAPPLRYYVKGSKAVQ